MNSEMFNTIVTIMGYIGIGAYCLVILLILLLIFLKTTKLSE